MGKFQDKKLSKTRLKIWVKLILLLLLAFFLAKGLVDIYRKNKGAGLNRVSSDKEVRELEEQREYLADRLASLKTKRGEEAEIRKNFSVVKPGEKVIVVVDPDDASTSTSTDQGWWGGLKSWFKN
ncbi:MAG: septum formation initiator family protein [bacterium]